MSHIAVACIGILIGFWWGLSKHGPEMFDRIIRNGNSAMEAELIKDCQKRIYVKCNWWGCTEETR